MMLDVLFKIKDDQDHSLAFRRSCRCAVHICPDGAYLWHSACVFLFILKVYRNLLALATSQTKAPSTGFGYTCTGVVLCSVNVCHVAIEASVSPTGYSTQVAQTNASSAHHC